MTDVHVWLFLVMETCRRFPSTTRSGFSSRRSITAREATNRLLRRAACTCQYRRSFSVLIYPWNVSETSGNFVIYRNKPSWARTRVRFFKHWHGSTLGNLLETCTGNSPSWPSVAAIPETGSQSVWRQTAKTSSAAKKVKAKIITEYYGTFITLHKFGLLFSSSKPSWVDPRVRYDVTNMNLDCSLNLMSRWYFTWRRIYMAKTYGWNINVLTTATWVTACRRPKPRLK